MSKARKILGDDAGRSPQGAALPTPQPEPSASPQSPPQCSPALNAADLAGFRVAFARDLMMQSIQIEISRAKFVGIDPGSHAEFAVEVADALIAALTRAK